MKERGTYRSTYAVMLDDGDFQKLPPEARHLFHVIKNTRLNNMAGIFVCDAGGLVTLAQQTGYTIKGIRRGIDTLSKGNWIVYDGVILWVRNQLKFDPNVVLNNPKHTSGVLNVLKSLPRSEIVVKYCDYYRLAYPFDTLSYTPSIPPRITETDTETDTEPETETDTETDCAKPRRQQPRMSFDEFRASETGQKLFTSYMDTYSEQTIRTQIEGMRNWLKGQPDRSTSTVKGWSAFVGRWFTKYALDLKKSGGGEASLTWQQEQEHYAAKRRTEGSGGLSSIGALLADINPKDTAPDEPGP